MQGKKLTESAGVNFKAQLAETYYKNSFFFLFPQTNELIEIILIYILTKTNLLLANILGEVLSIRI